MHKCVYICVYLHIYIYILCVSISQRHVLRVQTKLDEPQVYLKPVEQILYSATAPIKKTVYLYLKDTFYVYKNIKWTLYIESTIEWTLYIYA